MLVIIIFAIFELSSANLPPIFVKDMNNFVISETTSVGTVVYKLDGYDPEGSTVTYGIEDTQYFEVNSFTGNVKLIKALDREVSKHFDLCIL